jgi:hypothetical protein
MRLNQQICWVRLEACTTCVLQEADEDGSGELDPDEFFEKLGPYLGQGMSQTDCARLFMRIDADCGGTIDWQVGASGCCCWAAAVMWYTI